MTTITGTAALHSDRYSLSPVSAERLEAALGPGRYLLDGSVFSDDRTPETAGVPLDGECRYYRADEPTVRRLSVTLGNRQLPYSAYDNARRVQHGDRRARPIVGADGYVVTADVTDHDGTTGERAVGAVFDGDRFVIANILVPTPGVDAAPEASAIAREALEAFRHPMSTFEQAGRAGRP